MTGHEQLTILAVDDDAGALAVVQSLLEDEGFRVTTARDGVQALQLAQEHDPSLIITDILMPNMDGYQLCREIKRDIRLHRTPLIFYSATYTDPDDRALALGIGAARFIVKPADPSLLRRSVQEVLDEHDKGQSSAITPSASDEEDYLRKYNRRLIAKLEDKIEQLDATNLRLREQYRRVRDAEATVRQLAFHDQLTGLPNRTRMLERLEEVFEGTRARCAVLVVDLDRFHEVNHALGHRKGNQLLIRVAERLASIPGAREDVLAHLGGDEFALLLLDVGSREEASAVARRLIDALEPSVDVEGLSISATASVGISLYPEHGTSGALLLRNAEVAMLGAKGSRGSISFYSSDSDPYDPERLDMIRGIRHAIDDGQLCLHFQPLVDLRAGRTVAVEALVRWNHPQYGLVPPDAFIGHAEQTGQISALTRWLMKAALRQYADWQESGVELRLCLNLSARSLDEELPKDLAAVLEDLGIEQPRLTFEITESVIVGDPQHTRPILERLAGLGVEISIDDFGTGYSSLSLLKQLPVSELKIDKSFVIDMDRNENDEVIVRSTIELAHNLGLKVTAEGVETETVLNLLTSLDCDFAQGFLMAKPLPAEELLDWLAKSRWGPKPS